MENDKQRVPAYGTVTRNRAIWWGERGTLPSCSRARAILRVSGAVAGKGGHATPRISAHSPVKYPVGVEVKVEQQLLKAAPRDDGRPTPFVVGRGCCCRRPSAVNARLHFGDARCRVRLLTGALAVALCVADWLTWLTNSLPSELVSFAVAPNPPGSRGGIYAVHVYYVDTRSWQVHRASWQRIYICRRAVT